MSTSITATVSVGETSAAATGTGSDDPDTGSGFLSLPDGGGVGGMCDVWTQDCPEGEKCTPALVNNTVQAVCVAVGPNPGQSGDPCTRNDMTGEDSCDVGVLCVPNLDPDLMYCFPMCTGSVASPVCPEPSDVCVLGDGGATPICFPTCDPLIQDCEASGWACFPSNGGYVCAPEQSGGNNLQGDPCGPSLNTCAAGLLCAGGVAGCANLCCTPYCDLGAADPDAACPGVAQGEECLEVYTEPPPQYENVGICGVPP
jgi:hypothetical protein